MLPEKLFHFFATPPSGCESGFLGLNSWYHYLPSSSFGVKDSSGKLVPGTQCDISTFHLFPQGGHSDILLVLAAVVDDLLRIAGIIAVIFVIYGAIKYIASQGNSEDASKAQSTIINALVGMAIAMIGVPLVNYIGTQLGQ